MSVLSGVRVHEQRRTASRSAATSSSTPRQLGASSRWSSGGTARRGRSCRARTSADAFDSALAGVACASSDRLLRGRELRTPRSLTSTLDRALGRRDVDDRAEPEPGELVRQRARRVSRARAATSCIAVGVRATARSWSGGTARAGRSSPSPNPTGATGGAPHRRLVPERRALLRGRRRRSSKQRRAAAGRAVHAGRARSIVERSGAVGHEAQQPERRVVRDAVELLRGRRLPPRPEPAAAARALLVMHALPVIDMSAAAGERRRRATRSRPRSTRVPRHRVLLRGRARRAGRARRRASTRWHASSSRCPTTRRRRSRCAHGGRAWRGWFPLGGELTSGVPDLKEGLYFGEELGADDPRVRAGLPLHGANLFPARPAGLRDAVLEYIDAVTDVGHALLRGDLARARPRRRTGSTGTSPPRRRCCSASSATRRCRRRRRAAQWSVGEHTDYGLLTILAQDARRRARGARPRRLGRGAARSPTRSS